MSDALRVLIGDDHIPTRVGIRLALEGRGFTVCAEAGDARAAVDDARRARPDVCLLDVDLPGSGIAAAAEIAEALPDAAIVMLTVAQKDADLFAALEAGACGYLLEDTDPLALPEALRSAISGAGAISPRLVGVLIGEFRRRARRPDPALVRPSPDALTSREWEVLEALSGGLTTKQIARRLFIAETTVRRHVGTILRKLGASTREEAGQILRERAVGRSLNVHAD